MAFVLSWNNTEDFKECLERMHTLRESRLNDREVFSLLLKMPTLHVLESVSDTGGKYVPVSGTHFSALFGGCQEVCHKFSPSWRG